jgi:hypothetical protein
MSHQTQSCETTFGYLSAVQTAEHGYFGGYLIVCALGRPLEFHCTAPVRPSRAQEILYGPTLQPYLIGEQIGGTLLGAAKLTSRLVLTDQAAMLAVRSRAGVPMARVLARLDEQHSAAISPRLASSDMCASSGDGLSQYSPSSGEAVTVGQYELQLPPGFESERDAVLESIALAAGHIDLAEPFGRIHEAIHEAQRIGGRTLEGHGQAA